jgi:hypothetical protein
MKYQEVNIITKDKIKLFGWFVYQDNSKYCSTIIYFHENAGSNYILYRLGI